MFNTNTYMVFVAGLPFSMHGVAKFAAHRTKETAKHIFCWSHVQQTVIRLVGVLKLMVKTN